MFHDDQHGTAVVLYATLINALKVVGKSVENLKVVVCGIGAAGVACKENTYIGGREEHHRRRSPRRADLRSDV